MKLECTSYSYHRMFESKIDLQGFCKKLKKGLDGVKINSLFISRDKDVAIEIKRKAMEFSLGLYSIILDINLCESTATKREKAVVAVK